jgi:ABC-type multidrug transport system fused ATPase/permease subunit
VCSATVGDLFRRYARRVLLTYGLFSLENLLRLLQPLVLGEAINGLLQGSYGSLAWLIGQLLAFTLIGIARRMYDMRAFTAIYADLAARLVEQQRRRGVTVSSIAARSSLARAFVEFFERDVPLVLQSLYSLLGAAVLLAWYDGLLVLLCLVLLLPACVVNVWYGRSTLRLNARLHDQLEREVDVIGAGQPVAIREHYRLVGRWQVRLADQEALCFAMMEGFVLAALAATLLRACGAGATAGEIFAIFRYMLMFISGLDAVPVTIQQISRLRDIGRRIRSEAGAATVCLSAPAEARNV